jgi:hypothetical protein
MATANKVFVSPGVYTSERDLSFVSQSVGVTTLGLVGETLQGPAFEPIFVTSYDEFTTYFGGTTAEKFVNTQIPKYEAAYIAKSYLQQSNQLFVTRVLGLSGYDAGPSWTISTVANVDCSTVGLGGNFQINNASGDGDFFKFNCVLTGTSSDVSLEVSTVQSCGGTPFSYAPIDQIYPDLAAKLNTPYLKYDGTTSTMYQDIQTFIFNRFVTNMNSNWNGGNGTVELNADIVENSAIVFGPLRSTQYAGISSFTAITDAFGVGQSNLNFSTIDTCNGLNDAWFYSNFNNNGDGTYSGFSFIVSATSLSDQVPYNTIECDGANATASGFIDIGFQVFSGTPYTNYDNLVISTLRSRGISTYNSTNDGVKYQVSGLTDLVLNSSGSYSAITTNPFATFEISGLTYNNESFEFEVSLTDTNSNYINKVLGKDNFGKNRVEVPVFVEETYQILLAYGYDKGYIKGLNTSLLPLDRAKSESDTSISNYLVRYQTPVTPWFVSELRGNQVYQLFRFISISDGNAANTQIKISIGNVSFNNGNFDLFVRDFNDTDANPVVLEKFTNLTMDFNENNYIAKRIGSADGEFSIQSKYIMCEVNVDAPIDALPCGFEGYVVRDYDTKTHPFPIYKTKYFFPGETIFNPPFGTAIGVDNPQRIAGGDNVRRTYLGFSTNLSFGVDRDFLQFKGKVNPSTGFDCGTDEFAFSNWDYITKGFHMDSGATVVTVPYYYQNSGQTFFEVGSASFSSEPTSETNPYFRLFARKFTAMFYGGFDGWDIYREYRTNEDRFKLGSAGYKAGARACTPYLDATGWGAFRPIVVGDNAVDYANTDYYAYLIGVQTFANPEVTNINVLVTPGIDYVNNSELVKSTISMVEFDRADSIYVTTTPDFDLLQSSTSMDNLIYPEEAVTNLEDSEIDSNYTATYYPWVLTRDTVNNTQIYIPATAEVTRNLALTDNIAFPWFAAAGYTRGLVNAVRARKRLTQEDRDVLYKGRINPIATFNDVGTVIWGNKTLQIRQSALDRINVRRLLLQARKLISAVSVRLLFEQNDAIVRQQFLSAVNPILDSIRRDRGLYDFRVVVQNTPEDLDANQLVGKIYIKPTKALEFIDIEFLITPTGASFENI